MAGVCESGVGSAAGAVRGSAAGAAGWKAIGSSSSSPRSMTALSASKGGLVDERHLPREGLDSSDGRAEQAQSPRSRCRCQGRGRIRHRGEGGSVVVCHGLARLQGGPTGRGLGRASARTPARPFTVKRSQRPRPMWSPVPTTVPQLAEQSRIERRRLWGAWNFLLREPASFEGRFAASATSAATVPQARISVFERRRGGQPLMSPDRRREWSTGTGDVQDIFDYDHADDRAVRAPPPARL
jgi:hypothetical protein